MFCKGILIRRALEFVGSEETKDARYFCDKSNYNLQTRKKLTRKAYKAL